MTFRFAFAASAMLALAACGAAGNKPGDKPSKDFVVGNWGTDGNCQLAMELKADGTSDGPFGNWTYEDGKIGFADAPEMKIEVTVVDDKTMQAKNSTGGSHKMTRCP